MARAHKAPNPNTDSACLTFSGGYSLPVAADAVPPTEIEVLLSGDYKTRKLTIGDAEIDQIIANHKLAGVDPAVDREHESALGGSPAGAYGWVKALSKRPANLKSGRTALVATVEWTNLGVEAIGNKHFRYVSAGLLMQAKDRLTGKDIGPMLDHVALVKHPFVQGMQPLSMAAHANPSEENHMFKELLTTLGVGADADEAVAMSAAIKLQDDRKQLLAAVGVGVTAEAIGVITALKSEAERAKKLSAELETLRAESVKAERAALLDAAVADKRVPPAERAKFEALDIVALKACLSVLPKRTDAVEPPPTKAVEPETMNLSAEQKKILQTLGVTPEQLAKNAATYKAAVNPTEEK